MMASSVDVFRQPAMERHPLKKSSIDDEALLQLLYRWRDEAVKAGRKITRMAVAFDVISGFDLGDELGGQRLGFGFSSNPTSERRAETDRTAGTPSRPRVEARASLTSGPATKTPPDCATCHSQNRSQGQSPAKAEGGSSYRPVTPTSRTMPTRRRPARPVGSRECGIDDA
jgi:hypothetical protein